MYDSQYTSPLLNWTPIQVPTDHQTILRCPHRWSKASHLVAPAFVSYISSCIPHISCLLSKFWDGGLFTSRNLSSFSLHRVIIFKNKLKQNPLGAWVCWGEKGDLAAAGGPEFPLGKIWELWSVETRLADLGLHPPNNCLWCVVEETSGAGSVGGWIQHEEYSPEDILDTAFTYLWLGKMFRVTCWRVGGSH